MTDSCNQFSITCCEAILRAQAPPSHLRWIEKPLLAAFAAANTDAHRLCSSSEVWIERFGADLLVSYKSETARDETLAILNAWEAETGSTHRRIFGKYIPLKNDERIAPELIEGDPALPLETVVSEWHALRMDFAAGYSAGLFIDQRANRAFVRRTGVRRLLNTFAYTCSFSVAAALAGAETVSVDLSKKSVDRGRANFALNDIDQAAHRFIADDVLDVLPRLARKGETFDCIILDPPTFSRGNKGRRFQVEKDLDALFKAALEVAAPQANILISTNCTRLARIDLERLVRFALKLERRAGTFHAEPPLPDVPSDLSAQTLWVSVK